ncbi:transposable element Tcb2 transposase [Trichonephila clavipes]|nr:transposable element Tcb2 transposase [Trichonephila clavipes]
MRNEHGDVIDIGNAGEKQRVIAVVDLGETLFGVLGDGRKKVLIALTDLREIIFCMLKNVGEKQKGITFEDLGEIMFGRKPGQGRRQATTPNEDRYLVLTVRKHRNMNTTLLQQHLRSATGTAISTQVVRNRLHGVGLYARRPMVCVRLSSRHRCDRREWATEHVNWRRNEWSNVLSSDESHFSVHPDKRRIFIWRDRGSRNNSAFLHESVRFDGGGVLVYGGISIDERTDIYIIRDGPLTFRRYRDEILRLIVVLYAAAIGDDFISMDDNCSPPRANLVEDFIFEEGIVRMEGSSYSPGMNPIEHVWDALGRRVVGRQPPPKTLQELERALLEEWDRIPQLVINSLIDYMPQSEFCLAHFWLNGYVNKQNCRIWSEANPQVYFETPLHPEKLTVWCALWAGGIIGPYFFKNDEGHNVTNNGDRYRAMITNFFIPELNNHVVQELWFQQDGTTCHTARATIDLLKDTFVDRLISRFGPVNWPPRSCDLTPLDYFLWGYVKSLVYADKPQTLDHLEDNIRRVIADIRPQMLEKVIENWTSRLDYIRANRGSPMPEIIFKM